MTGASHDPESQHYDSFVVRLWMRGDTTTFHRAEVRHVQTDDVATATSVTLDWVHEELERMLGQHLEINLERRLIGKE